MKTLIYCIPLYLFTGVCVFLLLRALLPVLFNLVKMIPKRVFRYSLAGFLTISALYVIVVSFI